MAYKFCHPHLFRVLRMYEFKCYGVAIATKVASVSPHSYNIQVFILSSRLLSLIKSFKTVLKRDKKPN